MIPIQAKHKEHLSGLKQRNIFSLDTNPPPHSVLTSERLAAIQGQYGKSKCSMCSYIIRCLHWGTLTKLGVRVHVCVCEMLCFPAAGVKSLTNDSPSLFKQVKQKERRTHTVVTRTCTGAIRYESISTFQKTKKTLLSFCFHYLCGVCLCAAFLHRPASHSFFTGSEQCPSLRPAVPSTGFILYVWKV